jgi:CO/xanthine dehydrogenase FAD-binding subunit
LSEALGALAAGRWLLLAGGTDVYPAHVLGPLDEPILDLTGIESLRGIEEHADHWRIKALTTWSDLIAAPLPPLFDGLKRAAREVGGVQIQNAGTVGGNVCNAAPAADGVPCLLALDAGVELSASDGERHLPLGEFIIGLRTTARRPAELVTALILPKPPTPRAYAHFAKLGARRYLVISIVMVAISLEVEDGGRIARARVAVGACSPVACRLPALEAALNGQILSRALAQLPREAHLVPLAPIDDIRGDATYRREAALTLIRRGLAALGGRA